MIEFSSVDAEVKLGQNLKLAQFVNLYGCEIGDDSKTGACSIVGLLLNYTT